MSPAAGGERSSRIGPWKCQQKTGTGAEVDDRMGSQEVEGEKPLVLVIGFLGSNRRILNKYADVYGRAGLEVRTD